jgi:signal transduction histidine kinase/ActR/RegA family two-component response regulator
MAVMGDFAEPIEPVAASEPGASVYERFRREPDALAIPVVDDAGRPVGLIDRNAFFLRMGAEFGHALFANRPVAVIMDAAINTVEADKPADIFFSEAEAADGSALMRGFIVTIAGLYLGVVSPVGVLKASLAVNRRRADKMEALAQDLAWAESEAQASLRAKSQFLAVMSHEIRTPLNGVLGVAEIMERRLTQDDLRPYVHTIIKSGETLLRLLTDALDLSRAEAGALTLEEEPCDLAGVLGDLDGLWRPRAEAQGLDFAVRLDADAEAWVLVDEVRLKQTFNNLIGNALKFTRAGGVDVHVKLTRDDIYADLVCTVSDTGPGIAGGELESIFQPFSTGVERREGAGAGLGLTICRQIVKAMDGELAMRSEVGAGTAFTFALKLFALPNSGQAPDEPEAEALPPAMHVLVVDDNATNRMVAAAVLDIFGCTHELASDGVEAVAAAGRQSFDVILMDVKMPRMDGVDATRAIRGSAGPERLVPIIALTANADPGDAQVYLAAGMNAVVEKPLKPAALSQALSRIGADAPVLPLAVA